MDEMDFEVIDVERFKIFDDLSVASHDLYYHATMAKLNFEGEYNRQEYLVRSIAKTVACINVLMNNGYVSADAIDSYLMELEGVDECLT